MILDKKNNFIDFSPYKFYNKNNLDLDLIETDNFNLAVDKYFNSKIVSTKEISNEKSNKTKRR